MKSSHVPLRTCLGCGRKIPKKELIRFVLILGNQIALDGKQKMEGRGAYLCRQKSCIELAVKRKKLHRSFRRNIPPEIYNQLIKLVKSDE